jgi:hypothetical protein
MSLISSFTSAFPSAQTVWEFFEYFGEIAVIGCAGAEFIAEYMRLPKDRRLRKSVVRYAALGLIAGLAIELMGLVRTSQISDAKIASLNRDAAAANERAASLEKSNQEQELAIIHLVKDATPRYLTEPQQNALRDKLKPLSPQSVDVFSFEDSDAEALADCVSRTMMAANWNVRIWHVIPTGVSFFGVSVVVGPQADKTSVAAVQALLEAMKGAQIELTPDIPYFIPTTGPDGPVFPVMPWGNVTEEGEWKDNKAAPIRIIIGARP